MKLAETLKLACPIATRGDRGCIAWTHALALARGEKRAALPSGALPATADAEAIRGWCRRAAAAVDARGALESERAGEVERHGAAIAALQARGASLLAGARPAEGVSDSRAADPLMSPTLAAELATVRGEVRAARRAWRAVHEELRLRERRLALDLRACRRALRVPAAVADAWGLKPAGDGGVGELPERLMVGAGLPPEDVDRYREALRRESERARQRVSRQAGAPRVRAMAIRIALIVLAALLAIGAVTWVTRTLIVRKRTYGRIFLPSAERARKEAAAAAEAGRETEKEEADKTLDKRDDFLVP